MSQSNTLKDSDYKNLWFHLKNTLDKAASETNLQALQEELSEKDAYLVVSAMETIRMGMDDLEKTVIKTNEFEENNSVNK